MRKAFSLVELLIAVALAGAIAFFTKNFLDTSTVSKEAIKSEFQSHLNVIVAAVIQCKELSNTFPIQSNGSLADSTLLNTLECNTSTPYQLDGGQGVFIPQKLSGFTDYNATENGSEFYVSTSVVLDTRQDDALKELNTSYSTNQYVLTNDSSNRYLNFYISR